MELFLRARGLLVDQLLITNNHSCEANVGRQQPRGGRRSGRTKIVSIDGSVRDPIGGSGRGIERVILGFTGDRICCIFIMILEKRVAYFTKRKRVAFFAVLCCNESSTRKFLVAHIYNVMEKRVAYFTKRKRVAFSRYFIARSQDGGNFW